MQILLIDDNPGDVLLVQEALDEHQIVYDLHVVRDGGEALEFLQGMDQSDGTPCPDLVLLDLNPPKVSGTEVLAEFRKHPRCIHTPVIAVTSSEAIKEQTHMAQLGITRYFRKPSDFAGFLQLGAMVREAVETFGA